MKYVAIVTILLSACGPGTIISGSVAPITPKGVEVNVIGLKVEFNSTFNLGGDAQGADPRAGSGPVEQVRIAPSTTALKCNLYTGQCR